MEVLVATDCFTAAGLDNGRMGDLLTRFFFIPLASRKGYVAGVTPSPNQRWMVQMARNVTMAEWGCLESRKCLIHDRAGKFGPAFPATY